MYRIFLCDDDTDTLKLTDEILRSLQEEVDFSIDLMVKEQSATTFFTKIPKVASLYNIYILDIELGPKDSGLDLARQIRGFDSMGHIIFLTTYSNYLPQTFEYYCAPIAYIIKRSTDEISRQLFNTLSKIDQQVLFNQSQIESHSYLECKSGSQWHQIPIDQVIVLEYIGNHQICVKSENQLVTFYGNMKDLTKNYPSLMRIHQSFLINPHYIQSIDLKVRFILMENNISCPIGRSYWLKVKKYLSTRDK